MLLFRQRRVDTSVGGIVVDVIVGVRAVGEDVRVGDGVCG